MSDQIPEKVYAHFADLTFKAMEAGYNHYSADAILHRIRWHMNIEKGDREFKCNDHWTAQLSRWFHDQYPEHDGFFRTRKSKYDGVEQ